MQSAIERYLKENGYKTSIVRDREFRNSQEVLNAKAINLRREGMGKRTNKAQPLTPEEESSLWNKGRQGEHNGQVLTNVNFKNLTEQRGLRGRQEHYDSYVEDFLIRRQEDRGELVDYRENPTKTRTGDLRIKRRSTPQMMFSTDGGERDPVRLFKLWLSKRPDGMKDNGPLYLTIINHPKSADVWYARVRMGENTIGKIGKSMASCLNTSKKLTNHSMRKALVSKLNSAGQARNVICEITGHSRESSLDGYDEISENQRRDLSHIISGYHDASKQNPERQLQRASPPASSINKYPASNSTVVTVLPRNNLTENAFGTRPKRVLKCVPFAFHLRSICVPFAFHLRSICVPNAFHLRSTFTGTHLRSAFLLSCSCYCYFVFTRL
jgi:hypothetical protein